MNRDLLVFEIAGHPFSLPLDEVEEVVPMGAVTEVPGSPAFLLGLTAVRGRVLSVIDAAKRYGIGPTLNSYFLVCRVRGNLTAITIDRPLVAGSLPVRDLSPEELHDLAGKYGLDPKFLAIGFELAEQKEQQEKKPVGHGSLRFFQVDPDLLVSAEMASRIGED